MGTHCALAIRHANGEVERFERTLDGYNLIPAFINWVNKTDHARPIDVSLIGNGAVEYDLEGENDQEYVLSLDFKNKKFYVGWPITKATYDAITKLINDGWSFDNLEEGDPPMIEVIECVTI